MTIRWITCVCVCVSPGHCWDCLANCRLTGHYLMQRNTCKHGKLAASSFLLVFMSIRVTFAFRAGSNEAALHHLAAALSNAKTGKAIYSAAALQITWASSAVQLLLSGWLSDRMETGLRTACWGLYYTHVRLSSCLHNADASAR